jgi:hypothetical protein
MRGGDIVETPDPVQNNPIDHYERRLSAIPCPSKPRQARSVENVEEAFLAECDGLPVYRESSRLGDAERPIRWIEPGRTAADQG